MPDPMAQAMASIQAQAMATPLGQAVSGAVTGLKARASSLSARNDGMRKRAYGQGQPRRIVVAPRDPMFAAILPGDSVAEAVSAALPWMHRWTPDRDWRDASVQGALRAGHCGCVVHGSPTQSAMRLSMDSLILTPPYAHRTHTPASHQFMSTKTIAHTTQPAIQSYPVSAPSCVCRTPSLTTPRLHPTPKVITTGLLNFLNLYNAALIGRLVLTWFPSVPEQISSPLA